MSDLLNDTILASVDVHAIRLVIHRHHVSLLHNSVLLWQLRLGECGLIALLSNLLAHELLHPLRGLVVAGVGDYERHGGFVV